MNKQDNLRAFLQDGPFNLSKAAEKIGIHPQVLKDFVSKSYQTKSGIRKTGLGDFEERTFSYFQRYGYQPEQAYESVL